MCIIIVYLQVAISLYLLRRDTVMQILRIIDPVGVDLRAKKRFRRRVYHSKASYDVGQLYVHVYNM